MDSSESGGGSSVFTASSAVQVCNLSEGFIKKVLCKLPKSSEVWLTKLARRFPRRSGFIEVHKKPALLTFVCLNCQSGYFKNSFLHIGWRCLPEYNHRHQYALQVLHETQTVPEAMAAIDNCTQVILGKPQSLGGSANRHYGHQGT
jgi:hypothetical protein